MTGVRGPQQEVGPVFLLPLLLLLLLVISVVGNTCGCWGTNKVYVHYKAPVSGWFRHSTKRRFLFERHYMIRLAEPQIHRFQLRYMATRKIWLLLEKKDIGYNLLSKSNQNSTQQFIVSCPTGQCSCEAVLVQGSSCFTINGHYKKYSINRKPLQNVTFTKPQDRKEKQSQCVLAQLQECLGDKTNHRHIQDGCQQYTKPLNNNTKLLHKHEHYRNQQYHYNLTKADSHDFWLIVSENKVYAISHNTGPCPDQLIPDSRTWVRTDNNFTENITVTCVTWDNPSGD